MKRDVAALMPEGPWLYPEDQIADVPLRFLASEITREKLYERLHEELPYASTVETEKWEERKDGSVRIDQVIYVERDEPEEDRARQGRADHQGVGHGRARSRSRRCLERRVHLFLFVKVRENWAKDPERLRMMGLELTEERTECRDGVEGRRHRARPSAGMARRAPLPRS